MSQVTLRNVTKIYPGNVLAVKEASLAVENHEFVVVVGPSGCGKTTVLRMIAGLEEATSGEVWIGGRMVNGVPPKDRDIAMVFHIYALYPHMTVYDNMAFGLKLRSYQRKEIDARVKEAAQILGIEHLLARKPKELSGGERQRVAVGRTIVRKPLVFLFDEPLSNLDAKLRVQMRTEIHKLHLRLKSTMVYVTHDQAEAMTMGDRIVVMKDGLIQQVADPMTIYDHPVNKFVASFIGNPPMNFLRGRMLRQSGKLYFDEGRFKIKVIDEMAAKLAAYTGKPMLFGIRPEDIYDKLFVSESVPENIAPATVEVVEPMGSEVYLYLRAGSHTLIARVGAHDRPEINQDIDLVFDMSQVHFFDPDTEQAIV
ncbi:MAG: sn-glycerol-3-phosphate ABC transporter ATP-binding protein UgpC [Candidatus Omnitrophica bacterium]|nr:sn-glycerol-3-phosphate ABC transporter ATP-binding protein UgpC [Candidatus Omnitrophota bacterium]